MSSSPCVKMKWAEHLNTAWVAENLESAMGREGASELYERLVLMQEVIATPQEVSDPSHCLSPDIISLRSGAPLERTSAT